MQVSCYKLSKKYILTSVQLLNAQIGKNMATLNNNFPGKYNNEDNILYINKKIKIKHNKTQ